MTKTNTKAADERRWTELSGCNVTVFRNEFPGRKKGETRVRYSTSIGRKDEAGIWHNLFFEVNLTEQALREAVEDAWAEDDTSKTVKVNAGFLSCSYYTDKTGVEHISPSIVVTDGDLV